MIETSEIVTKLIITLFIVYIAIKFIVPILQFFWEYLFQPPQKSNLNIDILIERQKQILRSGLEKKAPSPAKNRSHSNKTLATYQDYFNSSKDQEFRDDAKKVLSLLDSLQWGEGPAFKQIKQNLQAQFNLSIEQSRIATVLKNFIETDFLLSRKADTPPSYQEIVEILELAVIIAQIFDESLSNEGPFLKHLSHLWKISSSDITKGLCFTLQAQSPSPIEIQKDILNNKIQIGEQYRNNIFPMLKSDDNKFFQSKKDVLQKIKLNAEFFSLLSPLEVPEDKIDLQCARFIFYANEKTSLEEIKKTYKKLAASKHPDKLSSHGIPSEFEAIATKNFSIIQQSYDILLNEYKNNETK